MAETFDIQSDVAYLPLVEERLFCFCNECNLGDNYSSVSMAALKAVENAIVHGNKCDAGKKVSLAFGTWQRGVYVEVSDEGQGFDVEAVESRLESDEMLGGGLFFMHSLADHVRFAEGGKKVRLEFVVGGIGSARALARATVLHDWLARVDGRCAVS